MIKAIITDVDGVIVGKTPGVNSPLPNNQVIQRLKQLHQKGIPVILCTAKSFFAIEEIVSKAELDNPHISDAGAFIYNPLQNRIINEHLIPSSLVMQIVEVCLKNNIYVEALTSKQYYIQKDQVSPFTKKRITILQQEPVVVDSLLDVSSQLRIIKILPFINDINEKDRVEKLFTPFRHEIHSIWSTLPFMLPYWANVITLKGVSKMHASQEVLDYLHISFDDCLGVGDLPPDWLFIKHCRYGGVVGNADKEFTEHVMSKGEGNYFIGSSVDEDGFLQILDYFNL